MLAILGKFNALYNLLERLTVFRFVGLFVVFLFGIVGFLALIITGIGN